MEKLQLNDAALIWEPRLLTCFGLDSDAAFCEYFIWRLFKNDWKENLV